MTLGRLIEEEGRLGEAFGREVAYPAAAGWAHQERAALERLQFIRDVDAVTAAVGLLNDSDDRTRENAVSTLIRSGDLGLVPSLIYRVLYTSPKEQAAIAEVLGGLGDPRAIDALYEVVFFTGEDEWARAAAAEAMQRLGDSRGVDILPSLEAMRRAARTDPFREE